MNKNIDKNAIINHYIRTVARGRIKLHYYVFKSLVVYMYNNNRIINIINIPINRRPVNNVTVYKRGLKTGSTPLQSAVYVCLCVCVYCILYIYDVFNVLRLTQDYGSLIIRLNQSVGHTDYYYLCARRIG